MKQSEIVEGGVYRGADGSERTVKRFRFSLDGKPFEVVYDASAGLERAPLISTFARWAKERVDG